MWATHDTINKLNKVFDCVKVGDEVAINEFEADFWWQGKVLSIREQQGLRETRFHKYTIIKVACHAPQKLIKNFISLETRQILFKD